ncbi:UNVERIFIED_CONTAM: hypothetical protein PYX00_000933 [Menopon gallinae]|uniref:Uncharacterized protein n=1 Tax=Menopon gallinae TaxID=328185 RepID=A0AAW2IAF6_9NEOP
MAEELRPHVLWISLLLVTVAVPPVKVVTTANISSNKPHSRQKRLLWLTTDGRLALPPSTTLAINPTLSLPFVRQPPDGFSSSLSVSLPFTIHFDKLGLTDEQNPYGVLPPLLSRSMGRAAGTIAADYLAQLLSSRRDKREAPSPPNETIFHGGERAMMYLLLEGLLGNFGMDGKACLLRAICEVHGQRMENFGFFGEVLKLFLTASRSPYAHLIQEYVDAEQSGVQDGECWRYYKDCSKSLFVWSEKNKYK